MFKRSDKLIDKMGEFDVVLLGIGDKTYFVKLIAKDGSFIDQLVEKSMAESRFYIDKQVRYGVVYDIKTGLEII